MIYTCAAHCYCVLPRRYTKGIARSRGHVDKATTTISTATSASSSGDVDVFLWARCVGQVARVMPAISDRDMVTLQRYFDWWIDATDGHSSSPSPCLRPLSFRPTQPLLPKAPMLPHELTQDG